MKVRRSIRAWGALLRCERGNFSVELALVSMILVPMLIGLFHYATLIVQTMDLRQAARVGVEYAITYPSDTTGIQQAVANSSGMDTTGLAVAIDQFCECPDGTSVSCTGTCASGLQGNAFVRVVVTQPVKGPLEYFGFLPGYMVEGKAVMRVR